MLLHRQSRTPCKSPFTLCVTHVAIHGLLALSIGPKFENSDVLRRRFQINSMSGMGYQYKSIFDAIKVIVSQEGVRGLYKGIAPNLLKVAPSMASSWLSFEMTRDFLMSRNSAEI